VLVQLACYYLIVKWKIMKTVFCHWILNIQKLNIFLWIISTITIDFNYSYFVVRDWNVRHYWFERVIVVFVTMYKFCSRKHSSASFASFIIHIPLNFYAVFCSVVLNYYLWTQTSLCGIDLKALTSIGLYIVCLSCLEVDRSH